MKYEVVFIPTFMVPPIWDQVRPFLLKSIARTQGRSSEESVLKRIMNGQYDLAMATVKETGSYKAAVVLEACLYETGLKTAIIRHLGGEDMADWLDLIAVLEQWARDRDCVYFEVDGRAGWQRLLKSYGYDLKFVSLYKDLKHG